MSLRAAIRNGTMGINLKELDKAGVRGWGATITLNLTNEARRIANLSAEAMNDVNLQELKRHIQNFEELQSRAKELNLNIYGRNI